MATGIFLDEVAVDMFECLNLLLQRGAPHPGPLPKEREKESPRRRRSGAREHHETVRPLFPLLSGEG